MPDDKNKRSTGRIDKRLDSLNNTINNLYSTTYSTRADNKDDLISISNKIEDNLDSLLSKVNGQDISDISNLYIRIKNKGYTGTNKEIYDAIGELFDTNKNILDSINMENVRKSIQAEDYQYDLICKYMPKLEDALEVKKDNVLSSDNFTKDFINIISGRSQKEYINLFADRANNIKEKYNIEDLFEDMYWKTSKYGEYFLYQVPYNRAFTKLLQRKNDLGLSNVMQTEGKFYPNGSVLFESSKMSEEKYGKELISLFKENDMKVNVFFDTSGIIPAPIQAIKERANILESHIGLCESWNGENDIQQEGYLKYDDDSSMRTNRLTSDGLVTKDKVKINLSDNINGCVYHEIPRENIIPIYMDHMLLGYLYLEVSNNYIDTVIMNGMTYNSLVSNTTLDQETNGIEQQMDLLVSNIAGMLSDKITDKFINANIDLKEQIYAVLRYNEKFNLTHGTNNVNITFLAAEDVTHFYFKLDDKTHRGISDLKKASVPAMIYCMLYLNDAIANVGRKNDKRVYYVKQNVEQNVAKTMLNVITQLKKNNMGMRQLTNMNTIFNVIGKYNDHIIPVSQSGDYPIQMEVMNGQDTQTPTELLERMEEMAVASTDVPLEFVQSVNSVDYASRFTMSNSKFLRKVYKRQRICQNKFTYIFRKFYNYEYNENDTSIKVMLPPPMFLVMSNTDQLIQNAKNQANNVSDIMFNQDEEEEKSEFTDLYLRNQLGTYLEFDMLDELKIMAKMNIEARKNNNPEDVNTSDSEY